MLTKTNKQNRTKKLGLILLSHFSRVPLCVTPQTAAHQAPPSLRFSRQEHWSGLPFPSPINAWKWKVKVKSLSRVRLLVTPWTAAYQGPPSLGFSRQEYWSGVPLPSLQPCCKMWRQSWEMIPTVALAGKIWSVGNCVLLTFKESSDCAILSSGHASAAQLPEGGQTGQERRLGCPGHLHLCREL